MTYLKVLTLCVLAAVMTFGLAGCEQEPESTEPVTVDRDLEIEQDDGEIEVEGEIEQDTDGDGDADRTIEIDE